MFIPDWSWTEAEDIPAEGWTMIVSKRNFCYNAKDDSDEALAGGTPLIPLDDLSPEYLAEGMIRLGIYRERPLFIMERDNPPEKLLSLPFRPILGHLNPELFRAAMLGYHLVQWIANSRFCGRCGKENSFHHREKARVCPDCGLVTFPRISPAVITAVKKDDRILLAHNKNFAAPVYSLIAGFVEPGESLEEAVAREISEEVGIEVKNIRYVSSQPWPFPDSLMLGFTAEWSSGEISPDGIEISDAGWFNRDDHPQLPLKGSIALSIIEKIFAGLC
jgi:NAD+ diphosphatase